jgi:hypothetical protein
LEGFAADQQFPDPRQQFLQILGLVVEERAPIARHLQIGGNFDKRIHTALPLLVPYTDYIYARDG